MGTIRLTEFNVAANLKDGTLVPLLQDFQGRTIDVILVPYPRGRVLAPRVKAFLQFLKEHFSAPAHARAHVGR